LVAAIKTGIFPFGMAELVDFCGRCGGTLVKGKDAVFSVGLLKGCCNNRGTRDDGSCWGSGNGLRTTGALRGAEEVAIGIFEIGRG